MMKAKVHALWAGVLIFFCCAVLGTIIYLTLETQRDPYRALGECERLAETHDIDLVSCLDILGRNR